MTSALTPLLLSFLLPQGGPTAGDPMAFYQQEGKTVPVTRGQVATEMAFHLRRKDQGRSAAEHLVASTLVRRAARNQGLWPTELEIEALRSELEQQLRAQGRDLMQEPVVQNGGLAQLLEDLAIQIAHEKLVRKQLGMSDQEAVSSEMLKLWLIEEKQRVAVIDDPDQLPLGIAVRIDDVDVAIDTLGNLLLRISDQSAQDRFVRQIVALERLEALGRTWDVEVTPGDIEQEFAARSEMAERDPRYQGMSFEQLLQSQGITLEWLRQSRVFRTQLLQKKLIAKQHPRAKMLEEIEADRPATLDRAGPRRRLGVIFVRAIDEPNELIPRDFPAAKTHLEGVRKRLANETFAYVARVESEDPRSKVQGGDLGWFQRVDQGLPDNVLAQGFALARDEVSEPVIGPDGAYLVKVLDVEPMPTDDELITRLREQLAQEMTRDLLASARITRTDGTLMNPRQAQSPAEEPQETGK